MNSICVYQRVFFSVFQAKSERSNFTEILHLVLKIIALEILYFFYQQIVKLLKSKPNQI